MSWQLVDHVGCLVCDFLESVRTRGCLGPRDGYVKEKDLVGVLCVCRAWVGKVVGLSVSLEWILRGSRA